MQTSPASPSQPAAARWSRSIAGVQLLGILAALLGGASVCGVFLGPSPLAMKIVIGITVGTAIWRRSDALVLVAGLGLLGGALAALTHSPQSWTTPLMLALATGASMRAAVRPLPGDRAALVIAALWIGVVVASAATSVWDQFSRSPHWTAAARAFLHWLLWRYPALELRQYVGVPAAAEVAGAAAVFAVTASTCGENPRVARNITRVLLLSGAALGSLAVYRLFEIALRRPPILAMLATAHRSMRISPLIPDLNAASVLFLLLLPLAFAALRRHSAARATGVVALPGLLAGLWLAGSRTALAVLPLAAAAQVASHVLSRSGSGTRRRGLFVTASIIAAVVLAAALFLARPDAHGKAESAIEIRRDLVSTSMAMVRDHPLFGVGIGNYYGASPAYMPPRLAKRYRAQNAHNQFLQVAGELGLIGLCAFVGVLVVALAPGVSAVMRGTASPELTALVVGAVAFLAVSLGMHPLLISEVSLAFALVLGMARAGGLQAPPSRSL